jgi:hypothetical protein
MTAKHATRWSGDWSIATADAAYHLIQAAGNGDPLAKGQLDAITAAAASGDPTATRIMTYFTPVARMVELDIGPPSKLQRQRRYDPRVSVYDGDITRLYKEADRPLVDDGLKESLEGRAAAYEAEVARLKVERAGDPPPVVDPRDTRPESAEGQASMDEESYPTGAQGGAPGDIEFTE